MKAIVNGRLVLKDSIAEHKVLLFDEKILSIQDEGEEIEGAEIIDAKGAYVAPGFIDIHIHGAFGYDAMDWDAESVNHIREGLCRYGVTGFLPTTLSMDGERIKKALMHIAAAMKKEHPGARVLGAHLEGPFISLRRKGAHASEHIIKGDYELIRDYLEVIKIITIAPEAEGNMALMHRMQEHPHISLSIGHSNASYEEAMEAIEAGIKSATHLFNAMSGMNHREPGVVGAVLDSDIYCELIADDIHVHPAVYRILVKAKGSGRMILITDAMRAACMKQGSYHLGGQMVQVDENSARLQDGTLAGSILRLNEAVRNVKNSTGLPLNEVINMVTLNPASLLGLDHQMGSLEPGKKADIVLFDENINIQMAIINGSILASLMNTV
jgi:N-acetylglucosamine-6-phosphate deacetylase